MGTIDFITVPYKQKYWQWFGNRVKIVKLTYAIIHPFMLQAWDFLHTVMEPANSKSHQQFSEQATK